MRYTEHMTDRKAYMRDYQRRWMEQRRKQFFTGKSCVQCGSKERLELDHVDPELKLHHVIWSWKESRRAAEIKKCQVLCHDCHKQKSAEYCSQKFKGRINEHCRGLTDEQVIQIRKQLSDGATERAVAKQYGIGKTTVHSLKVGLYYSNLLPKLVAER